jgi:Gluconate 2-dehydrogenase subunit 3
VDRREVLKLLGLSSALPAMPAEWVGAFRAIHASLGSTPALKILNPHQDATVMAMAELILPQTDTPGAKAVRVNEFIDRIVADWYSDQDRVRFLAGLATVDARTQGLFQKDFVDASPPQQSEILRALGEEMAQSTETLANAPRGYRGADPEPEDNFYFMFRQLTLTGYFTSEAGFTQQLHEEIIPGRFDGCIPFGPPVASKGS